MTFYVITRHRMGSMIPESDPELTDDRMDAIRRRDELDDEWGPKARHYIYELGDEIDRYAP